MLGVSWPCVPPASIKCCSSLLVGISSLLCSSPSQLSLHMVQSWAEAWVSPFSSAPSGMGLGLLEGRVSVPSRER